MVRFLIERGAEIDETGVHNIDDRRKKKEEGAPLHKAAAKGNIDLSALLLEKGAGLKMEDPFGQTPLVRAREERQEEKVRSLESKE